MLKRRAFLKQSAALGIAAAGGFPLSVRGASAGESRPVFHTRHIPIEHLNLSMPMGRDVVRNGLCDAIKPDVLKRLKDFGVELVEMRCVWWEIEPESGRFDWSRVLRDMDAVQNAGLKVGLFPWFQYPPAWYDPEHKNHARYRTSDGKKESTVLSLWDPKTLEVYDRLMGITAKALKGRISFVYNGISGTYGEVDYGLFAKHYRFSSPIGGYLFGDRYARTSFAEDMRCKYGSVQALNQAWETSFASFDDASVPPLPFGKNTLRRRDDCMQWATGSLLDFTDRTCGLYAKHFPGIKGGLPLGFVEERISSGEIKSLAAKMAAKHGLTARWTGCAHLGAFDRSNLLDRRIATAAHFYGAPFGTEAALILETENAANGLYESLANGASLIHDDPQNIFRAEVVQRRIRPQLIVDPPEASVSVFYPFEDMILDVDTIPWKTFVERCAACRRSFDYDVCDSYLIADGFLKKQRDVIFVGSASIRDSTARAMIDFVSAGGRVWLFGDSEVKILYANNSLLDIARSLGVIVSEIGFDGKVARGVYRFSDWKQLGKALPGCAVTAGDGKRFRTIHRRHVSDYVPSEGNIKIELRSDVAMFDACETKRT